MKISRNNILQEVYFQYETLSGRKIRLFLIFTEISGSDSLSVSKSSHLCSIFTPDCFLLSE